MNQHYDDEAKKLGEDFSELPNLTTLSLDFR
jgi:hypothetical protein